MRGIRIYHKRGKYFIERENEFVSNFSCLFDNLEGFCWAFEPHEFFQVPIDWYADSEGDEDLPEMAEWKSGFLAEYDDLVMSTTDYITKYKLLIKDSVGACTVCFDPKKIPFTVVTECMLQGHSVEGLQRMGENIEVFFDNYDSIWWEVYSSKEEYLQIVWNANCSNQKLEMEWVTLKDYANWYIWK